MVQKESVTFDNCRLQFVSSNGMQPHQISISVNPHIVSELFSLAAHAQQKQTKLVGFVPGTVPIAYIQEHLQDSIIEHLKQFLLKYMVISALHKGAYSKKIAIVGQPRLVDIRLCPSKNEATFVFELTCPNSFTIHEWKYFSFKAPKRKNYKDIDRQVENFMQEENDRLKQQTDTRICTNDWVNFDITLLNADLKPLDTALKQNFWFKIGDEAIENQLREVFVGRQPNETFISNDKGFQECFSDLLQTDYSFLVTITDVVSGSFFCFDLFRQYFRLKTKKAMHTKLIEVFSFRNDISQRCAIVEEALKLLINKHKVVAPKHVVLRQQRNVMRVIQHNPDYTVYKKQPTFDKWIYKLAEKQATELVFIEQFAYHENLHASHEDVKGVLNLTKRNRMKNFIHFPVPNSCPNGYEEPLSSEEFNKFCLKEKAINHIIYHLMKK